MNEQNARRISESLSPDARVVDVGGGGSPFPRADYVIDMTTYDSRAALGRLEIGVEERFSQDTWVQLDVCDHTPWPLEDNFFDYAVCSHLLEDVRDPIRVCAEMSRVARAGYIEVPSRVVEQSRGVEHPGYAGYYHHRWLVSDEGGELIFRFKPHSLHTHAGAIVANVGVKHRINPIHEFLTFEWAGTIQTREATEFSEDGLNEELRRFAGKARVIPDLTVPTGSSLQARLRKALYFQRLKWAAR